MPQWSTAATGSRASGDSRSNSTVAHPVPPPLLIYVPPSFGLRQTRHGLCAKLGTIDEPSNKKSKTLLGLLSQKKISSGLRAAGPIRLNKGACSGPISCYQRCSVKTAQNLITGAEGNRQSVQCSNKAFAAVTSRIEFQVTPNKFRRIIASLRFLWIHADPDPDDARYAVLI